MKILSIFLILVEAGFAVPTETIGDYDLTVKIDLEPSKDPNTQKILKKTCPDISCFDGLTEYVTFEEDVSSRTFIDLSNLDLEEIPAELAINMSKIESLNISNNPNLRINSEHFIKILNQLPHLDVSSCGLTGSDLKIILTNSPNLESLNFSGNKLESFFNSNSYITSNNLKVLKLSNCHLKANNLEHIFEFCNLEEIDLSCNDFSGLTREIIEKLFPTAQSNEIDFTISPVKRIKIESPLDKLKNIKLNNCSITSREFVTKLFDINGLKALDLSENCLNFNSMDTVKIGKSRESLNILKMRKCGILSAENLILLIDIPKLAKLDISGNNFKDFNENFKLGCSSNSLEELNVDNCHLNKRGLRVITDCPKLVKLSASNNNFKAPFSLGLSTKSLKEVKMQTSQLDINGLRAFSECTKLEKLDFSFNNFDEIHYKFSLKQVKETLKEVIIRNSSLTVSLVNEIFDCPNLESLDLSYSNLQTINNKRFKLGRSKNSLKVIDVSNSRLHPFSLKIISGCSKLEKLNASYNWFGKLKSNIEFGNAKESLKELDIKHCNLSTDGLKAIFNFSKLEKLDISLNKLGDAIEPFTLGCSIESLKEIYANNSNLNYFELKAISDCRNLEKLNVSFNDFSTIQKNFEFGLAKNSLKDLNLQAVKANKYILNALMACTKLKALNLTQNNFENLDEIYQRLL